jgi:hypothetical protein
MIHSSTDISSIQKKRMLITQYCLALLFFPRQSDDGLSLSSVYIKAFGIPIFAKSNRMKSFSSDKSYLKSETGILEKL